MKNFNGTQKSLFIVHMLRVALELFTTTFLTSYILQLNPDNVLGSGIFNIGIFYISQFSVYIVLYFLMSYIVDKSNRVSFLRIGIFINACLLIALFFWGEQISTWIVLAGSLCGISDAFYYPSYLVMKNELNSRNAMKFYNMLTTVVTNLIKIIVPTILGFLIDLSSYSNISLYIISLVVIQFIISYFIKCTKPENSKFEVKKFFKYLKKNNEVKNKIKYTYFNAVLAGFKSTYKVIVIVLTIYTFKTNLSLGLFTSVFSLVTMALLLMFKKADNAPKVNKLAIYLTIGILPLISCVTMVFFMNKVTLIIYNFTLTIATYFSDYFGSLERDAIIKHIGKNEFIAEHQLLVEALQAFGRIIAYGLFLVIGLFADILAFKILLVVLIAINPLKYVIMYKQRSIRKEFEYIREQKLKAENV